jgi:hypothetical protein
MLLASLMLAAAPGNELLEPTPGTMWFPSQPTTIRWSEPGVTGLTLEFFYDDEWRPSAKGETRHYFSVSIPHTYTNFTWTPPVSLALMWSYPLRTVLNEGSTRVQSSLDTNYTVAGVAIDLSGTWAEGRPRNVTWDTNVDGPIDILTCPVSPLPSPLNARSCLVVAANTTETAVEWAPPVYGNNYLGASLPGELDVFALSAQPVYVWPSTSPPTLGPSEAATFSPSCAPTMFPTASPTTGPSVAPTSSTPTSSPSAEPSSAPSSSWPSSTPSAEPSSEPSAPPTTSPSLSPVSSAPSWAPTAQPTVRPSVGPTARPTSPAARGEGSGDDGQSKLFWYLLAALIVLVFLTTLAVWGALKKHKPTQTHPAPQPRPVAARVAFENATYSTIPRCLNNAMYEPTIVAGSSPPRESSRL